MMMMVGYWRCGSFSEGIDQFQLGMHPGLESWSSRGGGGVGRSIVLLVLGRTNVCVHQSLSMGWKIYFLDMV